MSTQKAKFELYSRLQALGFTFEESVALRRIEMTLQRWAEAECGDSNDYCSTCIERDEATGKPYRTVSYHNENKTRRYPIADREAGALKRLKAIVRARNQREYGSNSECADFMPTAILAYHQTDCRGCMVYLVKKSDLPETTDYEMRRHSGEWPLKSEQTRTEWKLSTYYTRGLAACA